MVANEAVPQNLAWKDISRSVPVYSWKDFLALGNAVDDAKIEQRIEAQKPEMCCTLIYTSGTTGPPKSVMISHDNLCWTTRRVLALVNFNHEDRMVSYLPLSHIAAQMLDVHAALHAGSQVHFARPDALKGSLPNTLKLIRGNTKTGSRELHPLIRIVQHHHDIIMNVQVLFISNFESQLESNVCTPPPPL